MWRILYQQPDQGHAALRRIAAITNMLDRANMLDFHSEPLDLAQINQILLTAMEGEDSNETALSQSELRIDQTALVEKS
jgi:hypothetical protein